MIAVFVRQSTQELFHFRQRGEVAFNLETMKPFFESPQTHPLVQPSSLHQPVSVHQTGQRAGSLRQALPSLKHLIQWVLRGMADLHAMLVKHGTHREMGIGLRPKDMGKDPQGSDVWLREVLEVFVKSGCLALNLP